MLGFYLEESRYFSVFMHLQTFYIISQIVIETLNLKHAEGKLSAKLSGYIVGFTRFGVRIFAGSHTML